MKPTWLESPTTNVERAQHLPMLHKGVKTLCFFQTTYLNPTTQGDNRLKWAISNPEKRFSHTPILNETANKLININTNRNE